MDTETIPKTGRLIVIPEMKEEKIIVEVEGMVNSKLIVHAFSEKSKQQIRDSHAQKAKEPRPAKDPNAEFLASLYPVNGKKAGEPGCIYGIPAISFKHGMRAMTSRVQNVKAGDVNGGLHVYGMDHPDLVTIEGSDPQMREDYVRIGIWPRQVTELRYRGEFLFWRAKLLIQFIPVVIKPQPILLLLNYAGYMNGVCEMRPQKKGHQMGRYRIVTGKRVTDAELPEELRGGLLPAPGREKYGKPKK